MFGLAASPALPRVAPEPAKIPAKETFEPFAVRTQFLMVLFSAPFMLEALPIQITVFVVPALKLVMLRLRSLAVPPMEPSKVVRSAPFSFISAAPVEVPEIVLADEVGYILIVNGLAKAFSAFAPVSAVRLPAIARLTFPVTTAALMEAKAPPALVKEV